MQLLPINSRCWRWILLAIFVIAIVLVPIPTNAKAPTHRIIKIDASRFEYNPAVLKVNRGDLVTIELVATDVVHGLSIDGYNVETTADPGQTSSLTFEANREGSFRFHCTITCGNLHPFMAGTLEVGQNNFLWRAIAVLAIAIFAGVLKGSK